MSRYDYRISQELAAADVPFYALIMAAIRKADDRNMQLLLLGWPEVYKEFLARYHAPGGVLPDEEQPVPKEKPNCYQCKHRFPIPGDAHSRCANPDAQVRGNDHGITHGWFCWPVNFDPVWLVSCDGFAPQEQP